MSECSPKFIKCILRQVNISWIACIFSVSRTALVNTCLPHFRIAPLIATCCGSVLIWSQGVKHSSIHKRMLVQLELKSVAWDAMYEQLSSRTRSCSKAVYKPVWRKPLLSVQWINSWWWTEELSKTCKFSWQNKFVKLVHLVGFSTKKFVTMHGHMNIKKN